MDQDTSPSNQVLSSPMDSLQAEDWSVTTATIVGSKYVDDVAHFVINVSLAACASANTEETTKKWCTIKRYSNFEQFHTLLLTIVSQENLPIGCVLPGKRLKLWYNHLDPLFQEERTILLDNYLLRCIQLAHVNPQVNQLLIGFLAMDSIILDVPIPYTPTKSLLEKKVFPDDSEVTNIVINTVRVVSDHVLYQLDCYNHHCDQDLHHSGEWTILKRFNQFLELDTLLRNSFAHRPDVIAQFFPLERSIKLIYDHSDPHFVEQRRVLLENYIQRLLLLQPIAYNEHFLSFIGINQ